MGCHGTDGSNHIQFLTCVLLFGPHQPVQVYAVKGCKATKLDFPFCNTSLPIDQRVDDCVSRLTLDEKIGCMDSKGCIISRFGLEAGWKEALHGLRYPCARDVQGATEPVCASSFPHAQLLAASFNRTLWYSIGGAISTEARAFFNLYFTGKSASTWHALSFFAPDINLHRDPR